MLKIRYHHLNCLPRFEGRGYSGDFCKNLLSVKQRIENGEEYQLVFEADDICVCCPNLKNGVCTSEEQVHLYDILTRDNPNSDISEICSDCSWYSVCKKFQKKLI